VFTLALSPALSLGERIPRNDSGFEPLNRFAIGAPSTASAQWGVVELDCNGPRRCSALQFMERESISVAFGNLFVAIAVAVALVFARMRIEKLDDFAMREVGGRFPRSWGRGLG
jgi:hypothetical protein